MSLRQEKLQLPRKWLTCDTHRISVGTAMFLVVLHLSVASQAERAELKASYPPETISSSEILKRDRQGKGYYASVPTRTAMDRDVNNIAILVDNGRLIAPGLTDVTRTTAIASRFYSTHNDDFDYLNIFVASTFQNDVRSEGGFSFVQRVSNNVTGIRFPGGVFNNGLAIGRGISRLKMILNMNDLGEYNENPGHDLPAFLNTFSGVTRLAQEASHIVGSYTRGPTAAIQGRAGGHWGFFFQTYGSVLEGNQWRDNLDGTFTSLAAAQGYSQLDKYLWGFMGPEQVTDPMFVLTGSRPTLAANGGTVAMPVKGVTVRARTQVVTMNDIIAINGVRLPNASNAQKTFSMAWILVIPQGTTAAAQDLEKIDEFRHQWEDWFSRKTDGLGKMTSEIQPTPVTSNFESRVVAGEPGMIVEFDNDSFGSINGYLWDFGDGATSTERLPKHTYAAPGSYTVSLTVSGVGGPVTMTRTDFVFVGTKIMHHQADFESPSEWHADSHRQAVTGHWVRQEPVGSFLAVGYGNDQILAEVQPELDHTPTGSLCFVTGNASPGDGIDINDIDAGFVTLLSPIIDLSGSADPILSFWSWFSNNNGQNPGRDPFIVEVSSDGGLGWTRVMTMHSSHHFWRQDQIRLRNISLTLTDSMQIRFVARDLDGRSIVEAALDDVEIFDIDTTTPIVLQNFSANSLSSGVNISWAMSSESKREIESVRVQRSQNERGPYNSIGPALTPRLTMRFLDRQVKDGEHYWYRLLFQLTTGSEVSAVIDVLHSLSPERTTQLLSLRELPSGSVVVRYYVSQPASSLKLDVFDVLGRHVRSVSQRVSDPGTYTLRWDRKDAQGARVARGVYLLRLGSSTTVDSKKITLVR